MTIDSHVGTSVQRLREAAASAASARDLTRPCRVTAY